MTVDYRISRRDLLRAAAVGSMSVMPGLLYGTDKTTETVRRHRILADNLLFPEGPVALSDGSLLIVEIKRRTLTRIDPSGQANHIAQLRGGPNGAAIGPDGACYICNNGGMKFAESDGMLIPRGSSEDYNGGWIERVDIDTGHAETLYTGVNGRRLSAPNDLVFDRDGGFWFTDIGRSDESSQTHGGIYYAAADGSAITEVVYPMNAPNGIGLSPDGSVLYVAELFTGRLLGFEISGSGKLAGNHGFMPGWLVGYGPGRYYFDSLAIEKEGNICIAAPVPGQIICFSAKGELLEIVQSPGPLPTNICFGGPEMRTAYITLSGSGQLVVMDWPRAGLSPAFK